MGLLGGMHSHQFRDIQTFSKALSVGARLRTRRSSLRAQVLGVLRLARPASTAPTKEKIAMNLFQPKAGSFLYIEVEANISIISIPKPLEGRTSTWRVEHPPGIPKLALGCLRIVATLKGNRVGLCMAQRSFASGLQWSVYQFLCERTCRGQERPEPSAPPRMETPSGPDGAGAGEGSGVGEGSEAGRCFSTPS